MAETQGAVLKEAVSATTRTVSLRQAQVTDLNQLPDEVLVYIFSFVHDGTILLEVIPLVCKRWRALSRRRAAWKGVKVFCDSDMSAPWLLSRAPALGCLHFGFSESTNLKSDAVRHTRAVIQHVKLDHAFFEEYPSDLQQAILDLLYRSRDSLRSLSACSVPATWSPEDVWGKLLVVISKLHRLEELALDFNDYGPYVKRPRCEALAHASVLPKLRVLEADYSSVAAPGLLVDLVRSCASSLRCVNLPGATKDDVVLAEALQTCTQLRSLRTNFVFSLTVREVLPRLEKLHLAPLKFIETRVELPPLPNLQVLGLYKLRPYSRVTVAQMQLFFTLLGASPNLVGLSFSLDDDHSGLFDEIVRLLQVSHCPSLRFIAYPKWCEPKLRPWLETVSNVRKVHIGQLDRSYFNFG